MKRGLFIGLTTLDFSYLAMQPPKANQKLVASDYTVSAGGPATNAAVAFQHLGNQAVLLSSVGNRAITQLIRADLQQCGVELIDLTPDRPDSPPVSSIIVTEQTGERSVISINAVKTQATAVPVDCLQGVDVVLIDGHQMQIGQTIAAQARSQNIPVVIDGGSWKPNFETVLKLSDYAICSANFQPPECQSESDTIAFLTNLKIPHIAITQGEKPIVYQTIDGKGEIEVPQVKAIDTLGAGDIFHGAFCHAILQQDFPTALAIAAQVAANSCRFFGTRRWLTLLNQS